MLQTFNEKNRGLVVNINGHLVHRDQAAISPFDSSVQGGDAVAVVAQAQREDGHAEFFVAIFRVLAADGEELLLRETEVLRG